MPSGRPTPVSWSPTSPVGAVGPWCSLVRNAWRATSVMARSSRPPGRICSPSFRTVWQCCSILATGTGFRSCGELFRPPYWRQCDVNSFANSALRPVLFSICGAAELYGHADLHGAFDDFCDRWSEGIDQLVEDVGIIARRLSRTLSNGFFPKIWTGIRQSTSYENSQTWRVLEQPDYPMRRQARPPPGPTTQSRWCPPQRAPITQLVRGVATGNFDH